MQLKTRILVSILFYLLIAFAFNMGMYALYTHLPLFHHMSKLGDAIVGSIGELSDAGFLLVLTKIIVPEFSVKIFFTKNNIAMICLGVFSASILIYTLLMIIHNETHPTLLQGVKFFVVAICEEYSLRWIVFRLLRTFYDVPMSIFFDSAVFTILHIPSYFFSNISVDEFILLMSLIFLFGIVMAYLFENTYSLVLVVCIHWLTDWKPWNSSFHTWHGIHNIRQNIFILGVLALFLVLKYIKGLRAKYIE